ncbi:hypothetical protein CHELA20_40307 [Hyphomicrobiales bacterium]|nr:hypothetical protein CHELA20_40307 [Hyphomicrobiales bacterium]CAH1688121.1 hypothetical protein CHELA41_40164 [Hyphomicrobiales bacterium]
MAGGAVAQSARGCADETLERQVRAFHARLFPEEYDEIYDDTVDATLRRQGINPMSADSIARVDARRTELGFSPYTVTGTTVRLATLDWTRHMVRQGRQAEVESLCVHYGL